MVGVPSASSRTRDMMLAFGLLSLSAVALGLAGVGGAAEAATTQRVSVSSAGAEGDSHSYTSSISNNGRFIAFTSDASNLVAGDTNGALDIFAHDRRTGTTKRVSVSSAGAEGNAHSIDLSISASGRFVAFASDASNLVAGDTNHWEDVFVYDRNRGTTERLSVSSAGAQGNSWSSSPSISGTGRFVAFTSSASNLVAGDGNSATDIFVHDRWTGATKRASVSSAGAQGNRLSLSPSISDNGRFVTFPSNASNLVAGDTNNDVDTFVHDIRRGRTERVSVSSAGAQANDASPSHEPPSISANGRFVAFPSFASNLVAGDTNDFADVFLHDRTRDTTTRVSVSSAGAQANFGGELPALAPGGRYVAFESFASNLVAGDSSETPDADTFVHDTRTGVTRRASVTSAGAEGEGDSLGPPSISAAGRFVSFYSLAPNLISGDTNDAADVFVRGPGP